MRFPASVWIFSANRACVAYPDLRYMRAMDDAPPEYPIALVMPASASYDYWLGMGRTLAVQKHQVDWLIGDWIGYGREHYPDQITLAIDDLGEDQSALKRAEKTAKAFPPHLRHAKLSFAHHAHVADMPSQEAIPLLIEASKAGLSAKQMRKAAMLRKVDTGQIIPREDDPDDDAFVKFARTWNRWPKSIRAMVADSVADANLGIIEL